jgi:hypothetical protein
MNRWIRTPLLLSGICIALCPALLAAPAPAPGVSTVTCPANEDRVWVYDSLTSLDVEAKLHCGDTVQIVSRVKGYVKVRIASGVVGYMPDSVFPDLPPLTNDQTNLGDHNAAPTETTENDDSLGAVAAAYRARERAAAAAAGAREAAPAPVASVTVEAAPAAAPKPSPSVVAMNAQPASSEVAATVAPVAPRASSPANVSAPEDAVVAEPAPAPKPASVPRRAISVAAAAEAKPAVVATRAPAPQPPAPEVPATTTVAMATPGPMDPPIPAPTAMTAVAAPADASMREVAAKPIGTDPESEDYPLTQPQDASADPNCRVYFSAYGLGAQQYKWLSDTRQKQFSGICPAPNLKSVDFVILFTHDSDSYISAMPTPVHTDGSGFSDFDPLTTVDTALMSPTEADKARYELAWVFHVRRGAFNPSEFSPRRRPQYESTAKGSHASTKAVEDAFNFIQQQAPTR